MQPMDTKKMYGNIAAVPTMDPTDKAYGNVAVPPQVVYYAASAPSYPTHHHPQPQATGYGKPLSLQHFIMAPPPPYTKV